MGGSFSEGFVVHAELRERLEQGLISSAVDQAPKDQLTRNMVYLMHGKCGIDGDMCGTDKFCEADANLTAIANRGATRLDIMPFCEDLVEIARRFQCCQ